MELKFSFAKMVKRSIGLSAVALLLAGCLSGGSGSTTASSGSATVSAASVLGTWKWMSVTSSGGTSTDASSAGITISLDASTYTLTVPAITTTTLFGKTYAACTETDSYTLSGNTLTINTTSISVSGSLCGPVGAGSSSTISVNGSTMKITDSTGVVSTYSLQSSGSSNASSGAKMYMIGAYHLTLNNNLNSKLHALSTVSGQSIATISLNGLGAGVAANLTTKKIYVSTQAGSAVNNYVQVVNTATNSVVTSITLPLGKVPNAVAVDPTANLVYVSNSDGTISIIDGATDTLLTTTTASIGGLIKVNPTTGILYSFGGDDRMYTLKYNVTANTYTTQTISLLNVATGYIHPSISHRGIDIDPLTNTIYTADWTDHTLWVINGATNTLTTSIPMTGNVFPNDVVVTPSSKKAYVSSSYGGAILVIDTTTNTVSSSIAQGAEHLAINPVDGTIVIVAYSASLMPQELNYDPTSNVLSQPVSILGIPVGMVISP